MVVATYNVRTLAVKEKNGYEHAGCVLAKARQLGCDFIGPQETRRLRKKEFSKGRFCRVRVISVGYWICYRNGG